MRKKWFHGSPDKIEGVIRRGACVSNARHFALFFALRHRQGDCYLYLMLLDHTVDLEQRVDVAGVADYVLARDTDFSERILLTEKIIAEIKAEGASEVTRLSGND